MIVTYILSRIVFEIWQIIGQILGVCLTHSFGVNP